MAGQSRRAATCRAIMLATVASANSVTSETLVCISSGLARYISMSIRSGADQRYSALIFSDAFDGHGADLKINDFAQINRPFQVAGFYQFALHPLQLVHWDFDQRINGAMRNGIVISVSSPRIVWLGLDNLLCKFDSVLAISECKLQGVH